MGQKSYEVQVMQGGRWRIHAQFPANGRDDAIDEAKTLETLPGISGIKVVRDVYDDRSGMHQASTVYKHTPKKQPKSKGGGGKYAHYQNRANANRMSDLDDPFANKNSNHKGGGSSGLGVIVKLLLVLLFSIALSAILTSLVSGFMPSRIGDYRLVGTLRANVIIGSALVFFLIAVAISFKAFMGSDKLDAPDFERQQRRRKQKESRLRRQQQNQEQSKRRSKEDQAKKELARIKNEKAEQDKAEAKETEQDASNEDQEPTEQEPKAEEEPEEEDFSKLSPMAKQQKAHLMAFFGEAVRSLPPERKKMDNFNRFGLNLYLAGAAEALGGERNLDGETITIILGEALQTMGLKEEHAEAFARRYEDYLLQDARYMEIFQSGRRSISDFLKGKKEATQELGTAMTEWNKPKAAEDPEKEVVVMFTDIVGSTAMTHEKGNMAAQEVVRDHNRVVRDALAKTGGKEIKHTGDGIMASFENVTNSLLATQQMQMMIEIHNAQGPSLPLKVKIGINAGRVVMEEQDLYGVTVQMAARIVDKAKDAQIFVSDTVYGMAQGGSWRFVKRGPFYLKGIDGPVYLKELVWNDKSDINAIKAQAEAERAGLEAAYCAASGKPLPGEAAAPSPDATTPDATTPQDTTSPTTPASVAPASSQPLAQTASQAPQQPQAPIAAVPPTQQGQTTQTTKAYTQQAATPQPLGTQKPTS